LRHSADWKSAIRQVGNLRYDGSAFGFRASRCTTLPEDRAVEQELGESNSSPAKATSSPRPSPPSRRGSSVAALPRCEISGVEYLNSKLDANESGFSRRNQKPEVRGPKEGPKSEARISVSRRCGRFAGFTAIRVGIQSRGRRDRSNFSLRLSFGSRNSDLGFGPRIFGPRVVPSPHTPRLV
jgi:hypothetical protein